MIDCDGGFCEMCPDDVFNQCLEKFKKEAKDDDIVKFEEIFLEGFFEDEQ